jgi:acetylglutamate synthase
MEVKTGNEKVLLDVMANISKKLDELLSMKSDIKLLTKRIEGIEEMLIEELTEEDKIELVEALEEHKTGKAISLAEAEKLLENIGCKQAI